MITDRTTAKILGVIVLMLAILIDTTCIVFARPETRQNPRYPVIVLVSSVPMYLIGALLFWKASRMKDDEDDDG
jgi:hypothetical protein